MEGDEGQEREYHILIYLPSIYPHHLPVVVRWMGGRCLTLPPVLFYVLHTDGRREDATLESQSTRDGNPSSSAL